MVFLLGWSCHSSPLRSHDNNWAISMTTKQTSSSGEDHEVIWLKVTEKASRTWVRICFIWSNECFQSLFWGWWRWTNIENTEWHIGSLVYITAFCFSDLSLNELLWWVLLQFMMRKQHPLNTLYINWTTHTDVTLLGCYHVTSLSTMTHCATTCIVVHVTSCTLLEYPLPHALPPTL